MTGNPWARLSLFSGVIWGIILRDRVGRFPARGTSVHCGSAWSGQIHGDLRPRGALLVEFKGERRLTFSDLAGIGRALLSFRDIPSVRHHAS